MSPTGTRGSVVVGIDVTRGAEAALDWATAEAAARGCRLRIVHAFHTSLLVDPYGVAPPLGDFPLVWAGAEQVLAQAVARVRSVAPDLPVTTRLLQSTAVPALLGEAYDASVLVLGGRGPRGLRGRLSRSVSAQVAAHTPCPVVTIRLPEVRDACPSPPRVVVGVAASASCTDAVGFAFQAACQRLIATSHGAALLVIGTRGRGRVVKTVLGSVSDTVLRHSRCPLAIIRHDTARTPRSAPTPEREHRPGHDKSYRHRSIPRNRRWHA